jgi:hypothetical protein
MDRVHDENARLTPHRIGLHHEPPTPGPAAAGPPRALLAAANLASSSRVATPTTAMYHQLGTRSPSASSVSQHPAAGAAARVLATGIT